MRVFYVVRQRAVAILWVGQILSALGDRLYGIALMWVATRVAGGHAGYVAAAQLISTLTFGLLGGVLADRGDRRRILVLADLGRAAAVGLLPLFAARGCLDLIHLMGVGAVIGAFDAMFEPALYASLPGIVRAPKDLQPANALMDSTGRIARAVVPSFAGVLAASISLLHFFTLDAISFGASAVAISALGRWESPRDAKPRTMTIFADVKTAARLVWAHDPLAWSLAGLAAANITWSITFVVGVPLFTSSALGRDVGAYGFIVGAYGVGNVISNVVVGSAVVRRRTMTLFLGKVVFAAGFLILALSSSIQVAMAGAALAAVGGPMGDLMLLSMIQRDMPADQVGKVSSLRMIIAGAGGALGLVCAAPLFDRVSVRSGLAVGAIVTMLAGLLGLFRFGVAASESPERAPRQR
jgi:MFS family permease